MEIDDQLMNHLNNDQVDLDILESDKNTDENLFERKSKVGGLMNIQTPQKQLDAYKIEQVIEASDEEDGSKERGARTKEGPIRNWNKLKNSINNNKSGLAAVK